MSAEMNPESVCYVQCNFCETILTVNVPCNSVSSTIVTVRCGHCTNLLSVNIGAFLKSALHIQEFQLQKQHSSSQSEAVIKDCGSSSSSSKYCSRFSPLQTTQHEQQPKTSSTHPPEKRRCMPSAYNCFIKEEIQRIKTSNPGISHREAFSTAAKNWAHLPRMRFGQQTS